MRDQIDTRTFMYKINTEDIIIFVNDNWLAFAQENDARGLTLDSVLSHSLWEFVADAGTKQYYLSVISRIRDKSLSVRFPFRCDSPDCRRFMEMEISCMKEGVILFKGKTLRQEFRDPVRLLSFLEDRSKELLIMCSWCKKIKYSRRLWVEAEEAIELFNFSEAYKLPQISHGICPECSKIYSEE